MSETKDFVKPPPAQIAEQVRQMEEQHKQTYPMEVAPAPDAGTTTPSQEVIPPQPPGPLSLTSLQQQLTQLQQSYNSLQGKYNAEGQRYRNQIDNMEELIATLGSTPAPPKAELPADPDEDVVARIREDFGEETFEALVSEAGRRLAPKLREIEERVEGFNKDFTSARTKAVWSARENMEHWLDSQLPAWRQINYMPEFKQWLDQVDVFARQKRSTLLQSAWDATDGESALAFFASFAREYRAVGAQPQPGTPAPNGGTPAPGRQSLDTFAAPGTSGAPGLPSTQTIQGRRYKRSDILDLFAQKRRGVFRNRDDEWNAIQLDIVAAGREGRVDP